MPQLNNRCKWENIFVPPHGYKTDCVVLTTYSVPKAFFEAVPLWMFQGEHPEAQGKQPGRIMRDSEFRSKHYENRILLYYDGKPKFALDGYDFLCRKNGEYARRLYKECGIPVKQKSGLFHPKILVIQFSNPSGNKLFRVHISSRNLTLSDYAEAGVTLDTIEVGNGKKLEEVYQFFQQLAKKTMSKEIGFDWNVFRNSEFVIKYNDNGVTNVINEFAVYVNYPEKNGGIKFIDLIKKDYETIKNNLKQDAVMRITSMMPNESLFAGMNVQYICNFDDMYKPDVTKEKYINTKKNEEWYFIGLKNKKGVLQPKNLHTKQYIISKKTDNVCYPEYVWIGSANASENALNSNRNTEAMVRIKVPAEGRTELKHPKGTAAFQTASKGEEQFVFWNLPEIKCAEIEKPFFEMEDEELNGPPEVEIKEASYLNEMLHIKAFCAKDGVKIRPETLSEGDYKELSGQNEQNFQWKLSEKRFTNSIIILWENKEYRLDIEVMADMERKIDDILKKMPVPPLTSVSELISPIPRITTSEDEAWEKLLKHRLCKKDADFNAELKKISVAIEDEYENIQKVKQSAFEDKKAYLNLTKDEENSLNEIEQEERLEERKAEYASYVLEKDITLLKEMVKRLHS